MCPNFWWECELQLGYGPSSLRLGFQLLLEVVKFDVLLVKLFATMKREIYQFMDMYILNLNVFGVL